MLDARIEQITLAHQN